MIVNNRHGLHGHGVAEVPEEVAELLVFVYDYVVND